VSKRREEKVDRFLGFTGQKLGIGYLLFISLIIGPSERVGQASLTWLLTPADVLEGLVVL